MWQINADTLNVTGIHHQQQQNKPTITLECNYYCCNCIVLLDLQCIWFNMVFCNYVVLMKQYWYRILSSANQMEIYSLSAMQNLVCHRLLKLCFIRHHIFQHYSDMFKLNKRAKCLKLTINNSLMWIEPNFKPSDMHQCWLKAYSIITCVSGHLVLSSASETYNWYGSVLPRNTLLAMLSCLGGYEQCYRQLLKVLDKCCT